MPFPATPMKIWIGIEAPLCARYYGGARQIRRCREETVCVCVCVRERER